MSRCEAEVRHLTYRAPIPYRGAMGRRQVNEYAFDRCQRMALYERELYPARGHEGNTMRSVPGKVCAQHFRTEDQPRRWAP